MTSAAGSDEALAVFDPLVAQWFRERFGDPTEVQGESWPRIAVGNHVLITAPTGSGKTLTAFLWALNQLLTGAWSGGRVRVLYVSPLRALCSPGAATPHRGRGSEWRVTPPRC
jgi:ATP-dependent Lhr-like helicase